MLTQECKEFQELINESKRLSALGRLHEAINLVESRFTDMEPLCLVDAYHHTILIAREGGMNDILTRHVDYLAKIAPNHPVLKEIPHKREGGMNDVLVRGSAS
ncbi:MAG TPA: hypothetical protein VI685_24630 [Candidatus Angelobacter sp.]